MEESSEDKPIKYITAGLLAHVDAGKTTLSEALLYTGGSIRKLGRVDNGDAFLDTYQLERARGITIFSKQALLQVGGMAVTLLDTPGHVDFSAEMERTLQVLDYGILVISGADGLQGHTRTLWRLLEKYKIPVFLFVNKMDQPGTDKETLLGQLRAGLDGNCLDFTQTGTEEFYENAAMCEEEALEYFLEHGSLKKEQIQGMIARRKLFPCFFGSALKLAGILEFLEGFGTYACPKEYPGEFGAKVFKITRDSQGNRLTWLKITGGSLKVKTALTVNSPSCLASRPADSMDVPAMEAGGFHGKPSSSLAIPAMEAGGFHSKPSSSLASRPVGRMAIPAMEAGGFHSKQEKVNQIRIYSGEKYETVDEAVAGMVCAVTGPSDTMPGTGLGREQHAMPPLLTPVLTYRLDVPETCDTAVMLSNLYQLEEEEPELHIVWDQQLKEIQVQIMGEVQLEILKSLIAERFGVEVTFGTGNILYKETIAHPVEGAGHYEPLRHYAEVHLLLEPGEPGSGLVFDTCCSEDVLDKNWQRLVLTHLEEKIHRGVLTGSEITDMKITLAAGRAHQKHTEGGDFRQATYRALRQGLMEAESILLEPYYNFRLEVPESMIGRAMTDIDRMHGTAEPPQIQGEMAVFTGSAPVAAMGDYQREVVSYTRGNGRLSCSLKGYEPCHNSKEVIEKTAYDPERDLENSPDSVFCAHGAGFLVKWDEAKSHMHVEFPDVLRRKIQDSIPEKEREKLKEQAGRQKDWNQEAWLGEEEVNAILSHTLDANRREKQPGKKGFHKKKSVSAQRAAPVSRTYQSQEPKEEYMLVDGYNVIFSWEDLKELAEANIDGARGRLLDILSNYQGVRRCKMIAVFDAYRVQQHKTEILDYHNIHVVFTREAETADQYIEKFAHENARKYRVTVVTSDGLEQIIIRGQGCGLISAREFREEIKSSMETARQEYEGKQEKSRNYLKDAIPEEFKKK